MNYYPFFVSDYLSHTMHLCALGDIAFRRMLDLAYLHEKPLPLDTKQLAKLIRMPKQEALVAEIAAEFFTRTEAGWTSKRVEKQIEIYQKQVSGGKKGAESRWKTQQPQGFAGEAIAPPLPPPMANKTKIKTKIKTKEKEKDIAAKAALCVDDLVVLGVDRQHAIDWLAVRKVKGKGKPLTATALAGIQREADRAGLSLPVAIGICAAEGWMGFKADWLDKVSKDTRSFMDIHTDRSWREGLGDKVSMEKYPDRSWADGLLIDEESE